MNKALLVTLALSLGFAQLTLAQETQTTTTTTDSDSHISKGGLYIEPMLTATQEDETIRTSQLPLVSDDTSGKVNGYGVGLRFGGHVSEVLLLGLDARYSRVKMEDSFYSSANADIYNIAPMVGLQTPLWGIRLMAGYVVAGENNPEAGVQGLNLKFKEATGWRLGAGLHVAAIGVNLDYQDLTYHSTEIESFGSIASNQTTSVDANSQGYTLSLSFPIEL